MRKKIISLVLLVLITCGVFAGCSDSNKDSGSTSDGNAQGSQDAGKDDGKGSGKKTKIQISVSGSVEEMKLRKEIGDLYTEQNPDIEIEWIDIGTDRIQKTMTLISGGQAPDILYVNEKVFALADLGVLEPLDSYIENDSEFDIDQIYPNLLEVLRYDEKLYGIPQEISPFVVYYNKTMFEEKNVPLPTNDWTVDEFYEAAKALTDADNKIYGYRHPANWADQILGWIEREDVEFYKDNGKAIGWDNPNTLNALKFLENMVVKDKLSPDPADAQSMGKGFDAMFRNQKVAMQQAGLWDLPVYLETSLEFEWDIVKVPASLNQSTKAGVLNWCIAADSKNKEIAWDIIKFFTGEQGQAVIAKYNMALPSTKSEVANQIILDSKFPESVATFIDAVEDVDMKDQLSPHREEIQQLIIAEVDLLLLGQQTPEQTQQNIVDKANEILSK